MKLKWHLRLRGSNISSPPESNVSSPGANTSKVQENKTRHLSLHHEKVEAKRMEAKKREIEEAIKYCIDNNCKGYKAYLP